MNYSQYIDIFQGKNLKKYKNITKNKKTIVFDLDETIGSFHEVYNLFTLLKKIEKDEEVNIINKEKELLFELLTMNPEFFRYGMDIIFKYLHEKMKNNNNFLVYIYTNNTCLPIKWTSWIIQHIEEKWHTKKLFHNIVRAFKIRGRIIEGNRTSLDKKYDDFVKCVQISENSQLCFIDNIEHEKMKHDNVYYIRLKPYYHYLNKELILERFINSLYGKLFTNKIVNAEKKIKKLYLSENDKIYSRSEEDFENDVRVSKQLLEHIQYFFYMKNE